MPNSVYQLCVGKMLQANCKPLFFLVSFDLVLLPISNAGISNGKYLCEGSTQGDVKRRKKEIPMHLPY